MKTKKPQILVQDLTRDDRHIFVLNKSGVQNPRFKGPIFMTVSRLKGEGVDEVKVPNTWLPIDLCSQVHPTQLIESADFRKIVQNGMIEIISEDEADQILSRPGADQELRRIREEQSRANSFLGSNGLSSTASVLADPDRMVRNTKEEAKLGSPSIKVETLLAQAEDEEQEEISVINSLRNIVEELTNGDLAYILEFAKKNKFKSLRKWTNNRIAELNDDEE